jgi:hypothetical protein
MMTTEFFTDFDKVIAFAMTLVICLRYALNPHR